MKHEHAPDAVEVGETGERRLGTVLDGLDTAHAQVLEAASVAGEVVTPKALTRSLGDGDPGRVSELLEDLWRLALVWRAPEGLVVTRTAKDVLGEGVRRPGGSAERGEVDAVRGAEHPLEGAGVLGTALLEQRDAWAYVEAPQAVTDVVGVPVTVAIN